MADGGQYTHVMRTMHLFAGAGGGLLADLILGHDPACAVEWDAYCCAILRERAADGWFPGLHVHEGDIRLFDPSPWAGGVDCVHAGVPCQPWSVAGKREGETDERNLWPEVWRIARTLRPRYLYLENVPGLLTWNGGAYFGVILGELAALGFDARWCVLGADDVGAPHIRKRLWILADASSARCREGQSGPSGPLWDQTRRAEPERLGGDVADSGRKRLEGAELQRQRGRIMPRAFNGGGWSTEPGVGRVAHGVAHRVDRLKALGNGQVPLQAAAAWMTLALSA